MLGELSTTPCPNPAFCIGVELPARAAARPEPDAVSGLMSPRGFGVTAPQPGKYKPVLRPEVFTERVGRDRADCCLRAASPLPLRLPKRPSPSPGGTAGKESDEEELVATAGPPEADEVVQSPPLSLMLLATSSCTEAGFYVP